MAKRQAILDYPPEVASAAAIIDHIPVAALAAGSDERIITANHPLLELLGYGAASITGKPLEAVFRGNTDVSGMIDRRVMEEGLIRDLDVTLGSADGEPIPASLSVSTVTDAYGNPSWRILVFRDMRPCTAVIHELHRTRDELSRRVEYLEEFRSGVFDMLRDLERSETELTAAYLKLKETHAQLIQTSKLKALGELAAVLAHELKQPLTVIRGLAQNLLNHKTGSGPDHKKIRMIFDASLNMETIIKHLGVFSRAEEPVFKPLDLNTVITNAFTILKALLSRSSIKLKTTLGSIPPVSGSETRLEQVIINLVTNARDAMPEGGELAISTEAFKKDGAWFVDAAIKDTGGGMTPEVLEKIFDPFFTTKQAGAGTGLGLSISYGIIKDHGGDIRVESKPGKGSTFHIILPALKNK